MKYYDTILNEVLWRNTKWYIIISYIPSTIESDFKSISLLSAAIRKLLYFPFVFKPTKIGADFAFKKFDGVNLVSFNNHV